MRVMVTATATIETGMFYTGCVYVYGTVDGFHEQNTTNTLQSIRKTKLYN